MTFCHISVSVCCHSKQVVVPTLAAAEVLPNSESVGDKARTSVSGAAKVQPDTSRFSPPLFSRVSSLLSLKSLQMHRRFSVGVIQCLRVKAAPNYCVRSMHYKCRCRRIAAQSPDFARAAVDRPSGACLLPMAAPLARRTPAPVPALVARLVPLVLRASEQI